MNSFHGDGVPRGLSALLYYTDPEEPEAPYGLSMGQLCTILLPGEQKRSQLLLRTQHTTIGVLTLWVPSEVIALSRFKR